MNREKGSGVKMEKYTSDSFSFNDHQCYVAKNIFFEFQFLPRLRIRYPEKCLFYLVIRLKLKQFTKISSATMFLYKISFSRVCGE
jgi:hypothetical protein